MRRSATVALVAPLSALALSSSLLAPAVFAAEDLELKVQKTVTTGGKPRDIDVTSQDLISVPLNGAEDANGKVTQIKASNLEGDLDSFEVDSKRPSDIVSSVNGSELYVLDSYNAEILVLDTQSKTLKKKISGIEKSTNGILLDTDTGDLYVYTNLGIQRIVPSSGEVSEQVEVGRHERPFIRDAAYDAQNRLIWMAATNEGSVLAYSTVSHKWIPTAQVRVKNYQINGEDLGLNPRTVAIDPELGHLYIGTGGDKLIVANPATAKHLGTPIPVAGETNTLKVNPKTHEVYAGHGKLNKVSVITPETWQVQKTLDLHALEITQAGGFFSSDVGDIEVNADGDQLFVVHDRTGRITAFNRSGSTPAASTLTEAPGQEDITEEEVTETTPSWEGPKAAEPLEAPASATTVTSPELTWSVNDYMKSWTPIALGETTKEKNDLIWHNGKGWYDEKTKRASIAWPDGVRIQHYAVLAPGVITTFGNPRLDVNEDGTASLSVDLHWDLNDEHAEGYKRVTIADFEKVDISRDGKKVTIQGTPRFTDRQYQDDDKTAPSSFPAEFIDALHEDMRPWWYASGSGGDVKKAPNPLSVTFEAELPEVEEAEEAQPSKTTEATTETTTESSKENTSEATAESSTSVEPSETTNASSDTQSEATTSEDAEPTESTEDTTSETTTEVDSETEEPTSTDKDQEDTTIVVDGTVIIEITPGNPANPQEPTVEPTTQPDTTEDTNNDEQKGNTTTIIRSTEQQAAKTATKTPESETSTAKENNGKTTGTQQDKAEQKSEKKLLAQTGSNVVFLLIGAGLLFLIGLSLILMRRGRDAS